MEFVSAVSICRNTGQPLTDFLTPRVSVLGFLPAMFSLLGLAAAVGLLFVREWGRRTTLFLALAPFVVYLPIVVFRTALIFPHEHREAFSSSGTHWHSVCTRSCHESAESVEAHPANAE
jgi:hypothetical protein